MSVDRWAAKHPDIEIVHIAESRPGQVHALKAGIALATTELVAICDADTLYPPHYLKTAAAVFDARRPSIVAVLALYDARAGGSARTGPWLKRLVYTHFVVVLAERYYQAHAGGYAHCYRTAALKASGGYDARLWPFVIKDHELIHRVLRQGGIAYARDHWCSPSQRRADPRSNVRWTLAERILYHATPYALKDWFFYDFLRPRLIAPQTNRCSSAPAHLVAGARGIGRRRPDIMIPAGCIQELRRRSISGLPCNWTV